MDLTGDMRGHDKERRALNVLEDNKVNLDGFDHKYLQWKISKQENEMNAGKRKKVVELAAVEDEEEIEMEHGFD